ncbi:MAG: hypothetical protein LBU45_05315 [Azoarcus sp.]|nr:hypothetical protein [Azoarcus sp.]
MGCQLVLMKVNYDFETSSLPDKIIVYNDDGFSATFDGKTRKVIKKPKKTEIIRISGSSTPRPCSRESAYPLHRPLNRWQHCSEKIAMPFFNISGRNENKNVFSGRITNVLFSNIPAQSRLVKGRVAFQR